MDPMRGGGRLLCRAVSELSFAILVLLALPGFLAVLYSPINDKIQDLFRFGG